MKTIRKCECSACQKLVFLSEMTTEDRRLQFSKDGLTVDRCLISNFRKCDCFNLSIRMQCNANSINKCDWVNYLLRVVPWWGFHYLPQSAITSQSNTTGSYRTMDLQVTLYSFTRTVRIFIHQLTSTYWWNQSYCVAVLQIDYLTSLYIFLIQCQC